MRRRTADTMAARCRGDQPTLLLQGGVGSASRGSLASPLHQQTRKEPRQEGTWAKACRHTPAYRREVEHTRNAAAGSFVAVVSVA